MSVSNRYTFDSNVLFYAIDQDAGEKYTISQHIFSNADYDRSLIVLQTLGELCHAVHRKRAKELTKAHHFVKQCVQLFEVVTAASENVLEAIEAQKQHGLQFWDAMLWSVAKRNGCKLILSEDYQDGRVLEGVTFRNPFKLSINEIDKLLH
jgi:predicted nucleic acid-binding protein